MDYPKSFYYYAQFANQETKAESGQVTNSTLRRSRLKTAAEPLTRDLLMVVWGCELFNVFWLVDI